MSRVILHADLDNFFASVECLLNPEIANEPVAVCGDEAMRHGIVLAKNGIAKKAGIKTGQTLYSARRLCPGLISVPADYGHYVSYSSRVRQIYERYTPMIEPYGLDEAWLDVSSVYADAARGLEIAEKIRSDVRRELGLALSVGISYNKIFAKLGSDMGKPDGTALITKDNYRSLVWKLPVRELFFVGKATEAKLQKHCINTIGDIANADPGYLRRFLGKNGVTLWNYACGLDASPVAYIGETRTVKTIGNSVTTYRDLNDITDVKNVLYMLAEKVSRRLRSAGLCCSCVQFSLRYSDLERFEAQHKLKYFTDTSDDIASGVLDLIKKERIFVKPIRSFGVRVSELERADGVRRSFFRNEKAERLDKAIDKLYSMYGEKRPVRATTMLDPKLCGFDDRRRQVFSAVDNSEQTKF